MTFAFSMKLTTDTSSHLFEPVVPSGKWSLSFQFVWRIDAHVQEAPGPGGHSGGTP